LKKKEADLEEEKAKYLREVEARTKAEQAFKSADRDLQQLRASETDSGTSENSDISLKFQIPRDPNSTVLRKNLIPK
jgi:hypothetical protein